MNFFPARDKKASMGSTGTAPLIPNLGIRWKRVVNFTVPVALPQYPFNRRLDGRESRYGLFWKP